MSLSQVQVEKLGKRDAAKYEKACQAVAAADEKIGQIQADIAAKKKELDKLNENLGKAKDIRDDKVETKKSLAQELKSAGNGRP